ncbi:hypothetical protein RJ640_001061 [Escallonia rubra]|uniref:Uncharacterized protein n=1 Tax=Escallonia rubra TaxID=112253 RepID=A0AA88U9C8_9ASTE|nr:hypothetical protein RJ640_001061 [Escallonia rubra]
MAIRIDYYDFHRSSESKPSQPYRSLHVSGRRHLAPDPTITTGNRPVHRSTRKRSITPPYFRYLFHRIVDVLLNSFDFSGVQTDKVRLEIEKRRKRNSRRIIAAVEYGMMKRLRAKEEEIEKIGKLNWALEERVKSLCVQEENHRLHSGNEAAAALMDDAESCCGSNYNGGGGDN